MNHHEESVKLQEATNWMMTTERKKGLFYFIPVLS